MSRNITCFKNYKIKKCARVNSYWNLSFFYCFNLPYLSNFLIVFKKYQLNFFKKNLNEFFLLIYNYELFYKNLFLYKNKKNRPAPVIYSNKKKNQARTLKIKINIGSFATISIFHWLVLFYKFLKFNKLRIRQLLKFKIYNIIFFCKKIFANGFIFVGGLFLTLWIDSLITDDEPLWEPVEWSLIQTWILFIFIFSWIVENLIASRYGSYTGRDKRIWHVWYKTFWLLELLYLLSYISATLFAIVPFYYELTYNISFIFSWWNWYNRVFFFKFASSYTVILLLAYFFQINIRWLNWKKLLLFVLIINFFIGYLVYINFIMSFFGYFTDPLWYQKTRFVDYIQLSHEPLKWGWGPAKRDHFTYHKVSTVFWFKNDGPFASAFLIFHLFFFFFTFLLYLYWLALLRRVYTTKEVTYTFSVYCISALKQFFWIFILLYLSVVMSFVVNYWRFPIEFLWIINSYSWVINFLNIVKDYFFFLIYLI